MIQCNGKVVISDSTLAKVEGHYEAMNKYRQQLRELLRKETTLKKWVLDYALERKTFKGFVSYLNRRAKDAEH